MKKIIYLQKIGKIDQSILVQLRKKLEMSFKEYIKSVEILPDEMTLSETNYILKRRQYDAELLIKEIFKQIKVRQYFRTLAVMDEDIFVRNLRFIFGTARNPDKNSFQHSPLALISITRLRESFCGRQENRALFELRILKEAIHELGHTFSLSHCEDHCIMRFSNWIGDTDEKPPNFCKSCRKKLNDFFSISP